MGGGGEGRYFPGYFERGPRLLSLENRGKIEPKEIPRSFIPRLLVCFRGIERLKIDSGTNVDVHMR